MTTDSNVPTFSNRATELTHLKGKHVTHDDGVYLVSTIEVIHRRNKSRPFNNVQEVMAENSAKIMQPMISTMAINLVSLLNWYASRFLIRFLAWTKLAQAKL